MEYSVDNVENNDNSIKKLINGQKERNSDYYLILSGFIKKLKLELKRKKS